MTLAVRTWFWFERGKMVLPSSERRRARASVRVAIATALDRGLLPAHDADRYRARCDEVYRHVFASCAGAGSSYG